MRKGNKKVSYPAVLLTPEQIAELNSECRIHQVSQSAVIRGAIKWALENNAKTVIEMAKLDKYRRDEIETYSSYYMSQELAKTFEDARAIAAVSKSALCRACVQYYVSEFLLIPEAE